MTADSEYAKRSKEKNNQYRVKALTRSRSYLSEVAEEMVEVCCSGPPRVVVVVVVRLPTAGSVISSLELLLKMFKVNQFSGKSERCEENNS